MKERYCYWSVADGDYVDMITTTIRSARRHGVVTDFHVWSDRYVDGAICHKTSTFDKTGWLFKLLFLRDHVTALNYDYFAYLDADTYFVKKPGNLLASLQSSPLHVALECDLCLPANSCRKWWGVPNAEFTRILIELGVRSRSIFNLNGGFFLIHREAIEVVVNHAYECYRVFKSLGYELPDEPLLTYAMHMLCGNPLLHTLRANPFLWASDWTGIYHDSLPNGEPWFQVDYFSGEHFSVNPAIVHAMHSKKLLQLLGACSSVARESVVCGSPGGTQK